MLIVAITRMGDLLQASPTLIGIKQENPESRVTVMIDKQFSAICEGIPCIDEVYEVDLSFLCRCLARGGEGITDAYKYLDEMLYDLKKRKFDYCFNMSTSAYTALLLNMLGIRESRGWVADNEGHRLITSPWSMLFAAFVFHANRDFNSLNLVDIVRCSAGVNMHPRKLEYNILESSCDFGKGFIDDLELKGNGPVICVQAGASQVKRQWAPAKFAYLVKMLVENLDARVIFTGTKEELANVELIKKCYNSEHIGLAAGKTNLSELGSLLKASDLLITGDTGPMHMSVAVGTPVVALFLASALCFETGPYSEGNIVLQPQLACSPCNPNFPCTRPDCHQQISPELVFEMASLRLNKTTEELLQMDSIECEADPRQVAVYVSQFDKDDFLEFKQLNEDWEICGASFRETACAKSTYRTLWKEELGGVDNKESDSLTISNMDMHECRLLPSIAALIKSSEKGLTLLDELELLIKDASSPPQHLGRINRELDEIDRNIEYLGLSEPILGALVRMFIMEKENIRGELPLELASEMKVLYKTLIYRAEKFMRLFIYFYKNKFGLSAAVISGQEHLLENAGL